MADLLRTNEMAKRIGVAAKTLRSWARKGTVPVRRGSRQPLLFSAEEVLAALAQKKAG
jgi:predicted site-specific integrase-resolvase